jgi:hypothetical protein
MDLRVSKHFPSLMVLLVSLTSAAWAQPPDVVTSDSSANTAMGTNALWSNTSGGWNTASGDSAMFRNTTGSSNTASGVNALGQNTTGSSNTAFGVEALFQNTTGYANTAAGGAAMLSNTSGSYNVGVGDSALEENTIGMGNTAAGYGSLADNTTGNKSVGWGGWTLLRNTTGSNNTALGTYALESNTSGNDNIGVGFGAGGYLSTGSNNIDIGNSGVAGENGAIRIGTSGSQTETFIAGIWGSPVTGSAVYISSSGQLGVLASSERYKTDIQSMGSSSARLDQLRPVTFRLKNEPHSAIQYGLIAEEVAQVYPELVIRARDGSIEGVRYEELAPMLLNEVQQQRQALVAQEEHLAAQESRLADQARQLQSLERRLADDVISRTAAYVAECSGAQRAGAVSIAF